MFHLESSVIRIEACSVSLPNMHSSQKLCGLDVDKTPQVLHWPDHSFKSCLDNEEKQSWTFTTLSHTDITIGAE
jgi:hypothetical protein